MQNKGIVFVSDLTEFDKDSIKQVTLNLQSLGGCTPNPHPGAASGSTIPMPPFCFGPKSLKHLCPHVTWSISMKWSDEISTNMAWEHVMKNFTQQW